MVSALVSRALGMGIDISVEQLQQVSSNREGAKYADEEAASYLFGSSDKKALESSPFVRYLEMGAGKDGYWTYRHMAIQIEDCIDCLLVLSPQFDYVFELDHSSGHAHERPNGLSTSRSNLGWCFGGRQRLMRTSILSAGSIGPLFKGDTGGVCHHAFQDGDNPPILKPDTPKYDTPTGGFTEEVFNVAELRKLLETNNLNSNGKKDELQTRCTTANLPTKRSTPNKTEGYVGKAKGAAQKGYERGFYDKKLRLSNGKLVSFACTLLRKEGKKEIRDLSTSARQIISECDDFQLEKPLLEYIVGDKLGCFLKLTPKCHPEIAGRGVEYAWGYSKMRFRQVYNDGVASHLRVNVEKALDRECLSIQRIRKFAHKAREYKLTYAFLIESNGGRL
jgi:hypothetical protein